MVETKIIWKGDGEPERGHRVWRRSDPRIFQPKAVEEEGDQRR